MNPKPKPSSTSQGEARVLYIHPAKQGTHFRKNADMGRSYGIIPVGVAGLINVLRENGISVRGLNCPLESHLNPNFNLSSWLQAQPQAQIILIDLHWYEHCYGAIDVARQCKKAKPRSWIIMGGLTASGFSQEILEFSKEIDFIIRGDAEKPLLYLVQRLLDSGKKNGTNLKLNDIPNLSYRDNGAIQENPQTYTATSGDLDALNFVGIDFMDHYQEYWVNEYIVKDVDQALQALQSKPFWGRWLTSARGCRYHCSYCGGSKESHKKLANRFGLVTRSPDKLAADLGNLANLGVVQASMSYDLAEMGSDYWQEFFALVRQSGVKISIYNEFFQLPEPAFIKDFARSVELDHSCVVLSPLSGNERVRRMNGKHYSNAALFDTIDILDQYNLFLIVYFSMNLPGENRATFQETLSLARDVFDFYPSSRLRILNTVHTIDPFSPMNTFPEKFGIVSTMSSFMDFYKYCKDTQFASPEARTELNRGYTLKDLDARSLEEMANAWDALQVGRETSWWPVPRSW